MPPSACFCADIPTVTTRTRIVLVRHAAEISRTSNTGRLVARALPGCTLVDHGVPGELLDLTGDLGPDARVLYPGGGPPAERVDTLVVLDGSWSHVKGMRWRIPPLASLPSLSLPAPAVAPLRVRRGKQPDQLATIEAVAAALALLGEPEPAEALRALFARMAERMRDLRGFDLPPKATRS
jgi:DTW domain-containing protein